MKIHIIIQHITMALIVLSWSVLINSAFQKWLDDEPDNDVYNKKQALIDEIYNFEFNYEIKNDISMADIFSELLGDQMGFYDDEPNDWIYKITSIEYYEKVNLKLFQEMLVK